MPGAGPNPPRYIPTLTEVVDPPPSVEPGACSNPPASVLDVGWSASDSALAVEDDVERVLSRLTDQLARQIEQELQTWCQQHARDWADQCVKEVEPMLREAWRRLREGREAPVKGG